MITKEKIMMNIVPIKRYEYMMGRPVIAMNLPGRQKEFGMDNEISYINYSEEAFGKTLEMIQYGQIKEYGLNSWIFAENCGWNSIVDEFEGI